MKRYDVVIVGGGVNGLVAAGILSRAGRSVLVLEAAEILGGRAATDEFAPGFRGPATFAGIESFEPALIDQLELQRHGLETLPMGGFFLPHPDGRGLFLPSPTDEDTAEAVGRFSADDAEPFVEFERFLRRLAKVVAPLLANPLPELEPHGLGDLLDAARPAIGLRRLGAKDLAAAMRYLPMPIKDVVDERFNDELLRAAIAGGALQGSWLAPRSPGSALNLLLHRCGAVRGAIGFPLLAAGGPGALVSALERSVRGSGAEIRTEARVTQIRIRKDAVHSLALENGEEVETSTVISTIDVRRTLLEILEAGHLDPEALWRAKNIRGRGTVATMLYALDGLPQFLGTPEGDRHLTGRIQVGARMDDLERAFDATKYGRLAERPMLHLTLPSTVDPTLAPEGKHVLSVWIQYPPFQIRDGSWDTHRDRLVDSVENTLDEVAPGFRDLVTAKRLLTPQDLADRFGYPEGCLYHAEPALDQLLYLRPMPKFGWHETPLRGLYLGGAGSHGGGPLTGLAGSNAARRVLAG